MVLGSSYIREEAGIEKDILNPNALAQCVRRLLADLRRKRTSVWILLAIPCIVFVATLSVTLTNGAIAGTRTLHGITGISFGGTFGNQGIHGTSRQSKEKAIILASYEGQKLDWLHTIPSEWKIYRMVLNGREAYTYLSFIIDNYGSLPEHMIFLHGHSRAWHQIEPASWKIRALNLNALDEEGYINMRCTHDSGCTEDTLLGTNHPWIGFGPLRDILGNMMTKFWEIYLEPFGFGTLPTELGQPCCAQFAVTRNAVLRNSKEFYMNFRNPLEWSVEKGRAIFGFNWDEYHTGTLYEYLWHVVFGKDSMHCPDEQLCRQHFFSDAIACERHPGRYQSSFGWSKINCTSIHEQEMIQDSISRIAIEEFWDPAIPNKAT